MKSEIRNPKAERNPKPETRRPKTEDGGQRTEDGGQSSIKDLRVSDLGLRISDLFRISAFGFRISGPLLCSGSQSGSLRPCLRPSFGFRSSDFGFRPVPASRFYKGFTLIELLIVIAIISILAAMVIPISGAVNRAKIRSKARVELERVATGIDMYKAKLGHYPPDNPNRPALNQLYYELLGTTTSNLNGNLTYVTIDGSAQMKASSIPMVFGSVGGFVNSTQTTASDESRPASSFVNGLKPDEVLTVRDTSSGENVKFFVAAVPAPNNYTNFVAYVSSNPTNNPNSYDLWVDIVISGKTNRLSNWNKEAQILP